MGGDVGGVRISYEGDGESGGEMGGEHVGESGGEMGGEQLPADDIEFDRFCLVLDEEAVVNLGIFQNALTANTVNSFHA